jgi:predicted MFS family arabinose efflux permease
MAGDVKGEPPAGPRSGASGVGASLVSVGAMVVATATPYLVAVLAPFLTEALRLSPTAYGLLAASSYAVAAVASRSIGAVTDRTAVRWGLTGLMAASALSWAGLAAARGFWSALLAVGIGGVALAASNPLTNRMVAESRPRNYGLALGVKQSGVPLSAMLIGAVTPTLAGAWGWRLALCTLAPVPVLLTILGYRYFPQQRVHQPRARGDNRPTTTEIRRLSLYAALMGAGGGVLNAYLALFAVTELGLTRAHAGFLVALLGAVGIASRIAWASLSQRVAPTPHQLSLAVGATLDSGVLLMASSHGTTLLIVASAVAGLTSVSWLGVAMVAVLRLSPGSIGVSTGSVSRGFYLGLLGAPVGGGLLLQHVHTYQSLWLGQAACFAGASVLALVTHTAVLRQTRNA